MPSADLNAQSPVQPAPNASAQRYRARHKIRVVTAAALFDGHDAAIGVMRRVLQSGGAEVIHLGHNRGAEEVVDAAIQEDAQAIALSSYQGGHVEYFQYMYDLLRQKGAGHITIWGGGGGVIVPREIEALHAYGINHIFSPEDGRRFGLQGMIDQILAGADFSTLPADPQAELAWLTRPGARAQTDHKSRLARLITAVEALPEGPDPLREALQAEVSGVPVLGITGTGGAGKSSLTDELLSRLLRDHPDRHIAVVSVDPDASAHRRGAARRSHPHERAAPPERVHAQPGDPAGRGRAVARDRRRGAPD
jgi:methylmalonyl-CoA mutase